MKQPLEDETRLQQQREGNTYIYISDNYINIIYILYIIDKDQKEENNNKDIK